MEIDDHWGIDSPKRIDNYSSVLATLQGHEYFGSNLTKQKRVPAPEPLKFRVVPENPEHDRRVAQFYIFSMRTIVDAWIESGRDGILENPLKRNLSSTPLFNALQNWANQRRPELSFKWWTGEPSLYIPAGRDANTECPFRNAWEDAVRLVAQLLDSPYRYRIAKCRQKGCTYYYTSRVPKGFLKYGTYCPAHRQQASARRAVEQKRNLIHETRLKIARSLWRKWPSGARTEKSQKNWVVSEVNRIQSKSYPRVKINWVSRHLKEIVAEG